VSDEVLWHDLEYSGYTADLPIWSELAQDARSEGMILDVGAGTGRTAKHLAGEGFLVAALDTDRELLEELQATHPQIPVIVGDARELGRLTTERFALIIAPMNLYHMLGPPEKRLPFLEAAARNGSVAIELDTAPDEPWDAEYLTEKDLPEPERGYLDGVVYESHPLAVRVTPEYTDMVRDRVSYPEDDPEDLKLHGEHVIRLWRCTPADLAREAARAGLRVERELPIPQTRDHYPSTVFLLR
jgi:SAM-dependent methyltransferase